MGTSDAFGGSDTTDWTTAKHTYLDALEAPGPISQATADQVAQTLGAALTRGNRKPLPRDYRELLATHRNSATTSAAGHGRTRRGGASVSRQASRGGLAIAAFDAWRRGDTEAARDLGLDLSRLSQLHGRELCVALVDMIIGPPMHPDDVALRKVLITLLRKAENEVPPPTLQELVCRLVEALTWELATVQIATDLRTKQISEARARSMQSKVKRFIGGSVRKWRGHLSQHSPQYIHNYAARLAQRACRALGKAHD